MANELGTPTLGTKQDPFQASLPVERVWGLRWEDHLPYALTDTIELTRVDPEEGLRLMAQHFPTIYEESAGERRFAESADPQVVAQRQEYYRSFGDFFVFREGETFCGMAICTFLDWSSYNFRNIAIHPQFQNQHLYFRFFEFLCETLKMFSVRRIEGEVSPTNRHHIHVLNKMGYVVSAVNYSERWGVFLHITKYLFQEDEDKFGQLFSSTYASDRQHNRKFNKTGASPTIN